jgi:hypothetical protein
LSNKLIQILKRYSWKFSSVISSKGIPVNLISKLLVLILELVLALSSEMLGTSISTFLMFKILFSILSSLKILNLSDRLSMDSKT